MNKKIRTIEKKSMENLLKYDWPGNVRELSAIVERAVIISESDVLSIDFIAHGGGKGSRKMYDGTLEEVEREHILQVLKDVEDVIEGPKGAALRLGINPSTLRSRMRKLGIHRRGNGYR
jgi:DNA-binding NtrC family response regulator